MLKFLNQHFIMLLVGQLIKTEILAPGLSKEIYYGWVFRKLLYLLAHQKIGFLTSLPNPMFN